MGASVVVLQIADLCLEADRRNEVILSKPVVAKAIDAVTYWVELFIT